MDDKLQVAIRAGNLSRVGLLVEGGAIVAGTRAHIPPLHQAAIWGETLINQWLLAED
jgi:hypothetical protein